MLRALCSGRRELGSFGKLEDSDLPSEVRLFFEGNGILASDATRKEIA